MFAVNGLIGGRLRVTVPLLWLLTGCVIHEGDEVLAGACRADADCPIDHLCQLRTGLCVPRPDATADDRRPGASADGSGGTSPNDAAPPRRPGDSGRDAGPTDGGTLDAGHDAPPDATNDGARDVGSDAGRSDGAPFDVGDAVAPDATNDATPDGGSDGAPEVPNEGRELQLEEPRERIVFHGEVEALRVLYRAADGRPIPDATVRARLIDRLGADRTVPGVDGSTLEAARARTDARGWAVFRVRAGDRGTQFRVEVSADGAPAVSWRVNITRDGTGSIRVRVAYDDRTGRYGFDELQRVDVSLFEEPGQRCEALRESAGELRGADLAIAIEPFGPMSNETTIDDLDEGARFTLTAQVRSTHGPVVAFGCAEGVEVRGGAVTTIDIPATDRPLQSRGRYRVISRFRMSGLMRGSGNPAAETVARVLDALRIIGDQPGERGESVVRLFCEVVDVDAGVCRTVETLGAGLIERAIERFVPAPVLQVLSRVGDAPTILENMTVVGEFELLSDRPGPDGLFHGNDHRWQIFRLVWREGCPQRGAACERAFAVGDLDDARRPIAGRFTAELADGRLHVRPHTVNVPLHLVLLGILERWLIPAIAAEPGPQTPLALGEVLAERMPCEQINDFFGDRTPGICEEVFVDALGDVLPDSIGRFGAEVEAVVLEGDGEALDTDHDLRIDTLANGVWRGTVRYADGSVAPFSGCFRGCRPEMECDDGCEIPAPMDEMD